MFKYSSETVSWLANAMSGFLKMTGYLRGYSSDEFLGEKVG